MATANRSVSALSPHILALVEFAAALYRPEEFSVNRGAGVLLRNPAWSRSRIRRRRNNCCLPPGCVAGQP
ncbi:hypothetical protein ACH518_12815 [Methylomonas sp. HW2-6]|uniref:hypothetical protein n=1 Tax=Methylomonas sp. HW2-6 TaxID=3376687 RepID=UPI00404361D9